MKKLIKKITTLLIVASLVMTVPMNAFASSEQKEYESMPVKIDSGLQSVQATFYVKSSTVTLSEYDIICELRKLTNEELLDIGFTSEEISKIKSVARA